MMAPSRTWCGSRSISSRLLKVPGSDSSKFTTRYVGRPVSCGTNDHFTPAGDPPPPRPRRPRPFAPPEGPDQLAHPLGRHAVVVREVDLDHGRRVARAQAFLLVDGE